MARYPMTRCRRPLITYPARASLSKTPFCANRVTSEEEFTA
jgi:hypothetical protein